MIELGPLNIPKPQWPSPEPVAFDYAAAYDIFVHTPASHIFCINRETMRVCIVLSVMQAKEFFDDGTVPR